MRRVLRGALAITIGALAIAPWPARADDASVDVNDDFFSPAQVTVRIGDAVTWTVKGSHPHSVTFDGDEADSSPSCGGVTDPLGSNCMHNGDAFTVSFDGAGRFSYHCRVHGTAMVGTVIVESTTTTSATTSTSTSSTTTTVGSSDSSSESELSQGPAPTFTATTRVALPKSIVRNAGRTSDDLTPWVLLDVAIAGATTITGVVLVRKGRVPFG